MVEVCEEGNSWSLREKKPEKQDGKIRELDTDILKKIYPKNMNTCRGV